MCPLLVFESGVQSLQFGYFPCKRITCKIMLWTFLWGWGNSVQRQKCVVSSACLRCLPLSLSIASFLDSLSSTRTHGALGWSTS